MPDKEQYLIIKDGYINSMEEFRGIGCILIKDGKIMSVEAGFLGEIMSNKNGAGNRGSKIRRAFEDGCRVEVKDCRGMYVMPGIIDAHSHIGITEDKKGMEGDDCNETVNPITPTLRVIDAVNPLDPAFHTALSAGITSALITPGSSNVVGGQAAFIKFHGRIIDDMIVKAPAALKVAFGENPKVNYGQNNTQPATRMAIAEMLRKELDKAKNAMHGSGNGANNDGENIDFEYLPYVKVLKREIPLKAHVHRTDDIVTAIRIAKEYDVDMTLDHCTEGHLIGDYIKESGFCAILGPDLASRNKLEVENADFKTAGELYKKGVTVAITTDHPVSMIWHLPICAALAVKKGLPMQEALKAITINAAIICGVSERVGSIKEGKDADIAVFDKNPLDISASCICTIIDGKIVYQC